MLGKVERSSRAKLMGSIHNATLCPTPRKTAQPRNPSGASHKIDTGTLLNGTALGNLEWKIVVGNGGVTGWGRGSVVSLRFAGSAVHSGCIASAPSLAIKEGKV